MNRYDNEKIIIGDFQCTPTKNVLLIPTNPETISIFRSIHNKAKWRKWVDTSSKKDVPPDFYNPKKKLMLEVMRIDDHAYVNADGKVINPHNKRESQLVKELISKNEYIKYVAENGYLFIIPYSGLREDKDHNYNYYVNNFKRVVTKHMERISNYKKNHPGYKIVFFIMDESSQYFECSDMKKSRKVGEIFYGLPHFWWHDKNMIDCIKNSNIDYLIWVTPYKYFRSIERVTFPSVIFYDLQKIEYNNLIQYESSNMESVEI